MSAIAHQVDQTKNVQLLQAGDMPVNKPKDMYVTRSGQKIADLKAKGLSMRDAASELGLTLASAKSIYSRWSHGK